MIKLKHPALGLLVLRTTLGSLILLHGIDKFFHPNKLDYIASLLQRVELPGALSYGVLLGELLGPVLVISGYYCRQGAFLILVTMLFAIGLVHWHELSLLTRHGGWALELQGMYLFGALTLFLTGSGHLALRPD